jgi:SAM-dependent methyltransferase
LGRFVADLATSSHSRSLWALRLARPDNLFQPYPDTYPDRYPRIFEFVRNELRGARDVRLLSFGCSTGEEVFSLRRYFPAAEIRGIDINPLHIAISRKRRRAAGDRRMSFAVAGSAEGEPAASFDAVFCMAVFRHGELSRTNAATCDHHITFEAFERTVAELARCVKEGGFLVVQHSNFRFCDTRLAEEFEPVLSVDHGHYEEGLPLYGPDNRRLDVPSYGEVVFQKGAAQ